MESPVGKETQVQAEIEKLKAQNATMRATMERAERAVHKAKKVRATNHAVVDFGVKLAEKQAAAIEDCKALYMRYVPEAEIVRISGQPLKAVRRAINRKNGWKAQREQMQAEVNEAIKQDLLNQVKSVCKTNIELVQMGLEQLHKQHLVGQTAPNLEEVEILSKIFERLGRAKNWEETAKTGQAAIKSLSPQEVLRAFASDPYLRIAINSQTVDITPEQAALPAPEPEGGFEVPPVNDYEQSRHDTTVQQYSGGSEVLTPSGPPPCAEREVEA